MPQGSAEEKPPAAAEGGGRILQLHSTLHCNLACAHCYSASGPALKGGLDPALIAPLLEDAFEAGYRVLNVSGGEPLMDPNLFATLALGRSIGFQIDLITNGTLVTERSAARLAAVADLVAVSIDGPPLLHDALRRSPGSFERALKGLRLLLGAGIAAGICHTARPETLEHLRWLLGLAAAEGAVLVQLHPLEPAGRAKSEIDFEREPGELETRLALLVELIARDGACAVPVQCDAIPLAALTEGGPCARDAARLDELPLASLIDPLVVEPDGRVSPWVYGIAPELALGSLREASLAALIARYRGERLGRALAYRDATARRLAAEHPWPFVNWYAALGSQAAGETAPQAVAAAPAAV